MVFGVEIVVENKLSVCLIVVGEELGGGLESCENGRGI